MLEFARPYTPDLVGWFRDFGQGAANYDANGHFARIQPIFNAFQFTDNPAGGVLTPIPPATPLRRRCRPASSAAARAPPPSAPADGSAPFTDGGDLDCDPTPRAPRPMRRVAAVVLLVAAAAAFAVVALGAGDDDGGDYKVRAIFDNAGFVIPGEDVKVAGVKVGTIDSIDVTDDYKAAVVLDITDAGYQDFREDAECIVRPQSLIGERFVECEPTQARAAGEEPPPRARADRGRARARASTCCRSSATARRRPRPDQQHHARSRCASACRSSSPTSASASPAAARTSTRSSAAPTRRCKRDRRGAQDPRRAERRRSPTWRVDSDTILAPLARERRHVSGRDRQRRARSREATAERRGDLEADIERLPTFLRELRPTMVRLGALSDEMTPVLTDLGAVAPDINRHRPSQLGPVLAGRHPGARRRSARRAEPGTPAVRAARP